MNQVKFPKEADAYWEKVDKADDHGVWTSDDMFDEYEACRLRLAEMEKEKKMLDDCVKHFEIRKGWRDDR